MDIKKRIEEVVMQYGLSKKEVAERMGKMKQAFNSLTTDPKWSTIEQVASAIGISTEELLFGNGENTVTARCPHCGGEIGVAVMVKGVGGVGDAAALPQHTERGVRMQDDGGNEK